MYQYKPRGGECGNRDSGDEGRLRNEVEALGFRVDNETTDRASAIAGAGVSSNDDGNGNHATGVGNDGDRRTPIPEGRTPVMAGPEDPRVRHLDFRSTVESFVVSGMGSARASSSGSGDDGGDVQSRSPLRDPARGKDPVDVEEASGEVPMERPEFILAVGSSGHDPITKREFMEFVGDDVVAQLLVENPTVVAAVLAAREERQR
ncbi:hypothetical protein RHMOL_Rhmol11G0046600 [Rhododendron molle]|uniref:Uncharacterized protein n=1 Tax=Rhododendron molle TaxID=49168 RepID=A0ACC0LPR7_RHOML|nr:hypothetical protein RHMOL_Rhmol11G0046600 [Rhododendron molle]